MRIYKHSHNPHHFIDVVFLTKLGVLISALLTLGVVFG